MSKAVAEGRVHAGQRHPFRGRFALLFFFLLGSIVAYPYAESSGVGYYAFRILGGLIILLTVFAVTFSRGLLVLVVLLAVPSIVRRVFLHPLNHGLFPLINQLLSLTFDLLVIYIVSRHIFQIKRPDSETIFGALCIYLLVGFAFSSLYSTIYSNLPNAFYMGSAQNVHAVPDRFDFIYFSFGTLTELGTPGITPVAPIVRSVSLLEAIIGVLYLAVLISRLISAYHTGQAASDGLEGE